MRLFSSLRPSLALLGIQIDKANIVSHFEAVQRCSVGRLLPPPPRARDLRWFWRSGQIIISWEQEREKEGGRREAAVAVAARLLPPAPSLLDSSRTSEERHTVHVHRHPPRQPAESSEIVKACAGSQPPSCLRRLPWNRWSESIEIGSVVFREEIGELRATFSSPPFTIYLSSASRGVRGEHARLH